MAAQVGLATISVTIANGTSLSAAVNLGAERIRGIVLPAAWTAAVLTFQVSVDGTTFVELVDSRPTVGYVYTSGITVAASQYIAIDPALFEGVNIIKIRSGTLASAVNQGADRVLTVVTRL